MTDGPETVCIKPRGHRMVCGVCGGIAEYFGVDPTIVRLAFVLLCFGWGSGLLAYIVAALIMPEPPTTPTMYVHNS